mmetsp:Transcript_1191/g.4208  ORF Transcript_1191/g.4208 Transcript_1191/m.4208 type:complete len:255 (+) Transcript_1191:1998-2762(+)
MEALMATLPWGCTLQATCPTVIRRPPGCGVPIPRRRHPHLNPRKRRLAIARAERKPVAGGARDLAQDLDRRAEDLVRPFGDIAVIGMTASGSAIEGETEIVRRSASGTVTGPATGTATETATETVTESVTEIEKGGVMREDTDHETKRRGTPTQRMAKAILMQLSSVGPQKAGSGTRKRYPLMVMHPSTKGLAARVTTVQSQLRSPVATRRLASAIGTDAQASILNGARNTGTNLGVTTERKKEMGARSSAKTP